MYTNNGLTKRLTSEITLIESLISNKTKNQIKNKVIKFLMRTGISVDYALPYIVSIILSALLIINVPLFNNYIPFTQTKNENLSFIESIDTSTGYHIQNNNIDNHYYDEDTIEFSTAWQLNEYGVYRRTSITFLVDNKQDFLDKEKILYSSKDDLEKMFKIADIQTIEKNALLENDKIYNEDAIILVKHFEQHNGIRYTDKSITTNLFSIIIYIIVNMMLGYSFYNYREQKIRIYLIRDAIEKRNYSYFYMSLEELEQALKIKHENLELLNPSNDSVSSNEKKFYLRKISGVTHE